MAQLTFLSEEPPARASASRDCEADWQMIVATWHLSFFALLNEHGPDGWSGRTSPVFCLRREDGTLAPSSGAWQNSGMGGPTECWTLSTSEFHSGAVASSLWDILETGDVQRRFFLSAKACQGILRRAERRGKGLPPALALALQVVANH
jgi:hypothetical protein